MSAFETPEALKAILVRMAELMQSDPSLIQASKGKNLSISYEFPDLEVAFYNRFLDGRIEAGLGAVENAEMQLTMDSDVFDGMFTGKVNTAVAAMKGDISFSGNVSAAMKLQGLMKDFQRIYLAAKG